VKVMSWNTLYGGLDGDDERRFKLQVETVAEVGPDILLLQEAKRFEADGNRRLYRVEQALGMRGFLALAPNTGQNTAVFARPVIEPVSFTSDSTHFHHAAAVATLHVPDFGRPVTFISVHLCPVGVPMRLIEAANLVSHAAPDGMVLIAGDFNSVSPHDAEPEWAELSFHHRARYAAPDGKTADRRVMEALYGAGYVDIAHKLGKHATPTVPGAAFPDAEFVPFRADYFLASEALSHGARSYAVIRDDRTGQASDHYPIVAEFSPCPGM
jgi:exodeoxyribonuclease-3